MNPEKFITKQSAIVLCEQLSFVLIKLELAYNDPSDFIFLKYTNKLYRHLKDRVSE